MRRSENQEKKSYSVLVKIFPILFLIVGIIFTKLGYVQVNRSLSSEKWPYIKGKVVKSKVVSRTDSENDVTYSADIVYEYAINGNLYSGDEVSYGFTGMSDSSYARDYVYKYPRGSIVNVYYDPDSPEISVLEPGFSWVKVLILVFGLSFLLAGCYMFYAISIKKLKNEKFTN